MSPGISGTLNENKTIFALVGCQVELPFCRGNPLCIFRTVMIPKNSQIYYAMTDLVKINFIRPVIDSREILEQKYMKELF